ncbi:tripartite tricarboxylate transporter TctB family protein [Aquabacter sp. CN5-332]|uniref:tripartite tricarboxylate transporter TctB family protein n=1 Tax=Aquabacter sp. CN5-332 TaxID=3156608 RepID=UPI0032B55AD5
MSPSRQLIAGLLFIAIGVAFGYGAWGYKMGTALQMGPGYFPFLLSMVLVGLGALAALQGFLEAGIEDLQLVPWSSGLLLLSSVVFFGLTIRGLGMLITLPITVLLAALAGRQTGIGRAVVIAAGLTVLCLAVFTYGLDVPIPLLGRWVNF